MKDEWVVVDRCILGSCKKGFDIEMVFGCRRAKRQRVKRQPSDISKSATTAFNRISSAFKPDGMALPCELFVKGMLTAALTQYSKATVKNWIREAGIE